MAGGNPGHTGVLDDGETKANLVGPHVYCCIFNLKADTQQQN